MENGNRDATPLSDVVAKEIRILLVRNDLKQTDLAARMGATEMWVSRRLRGAQPIDLNDLQRFADALNVEAADLMPRSGRLISSAPAGGAAHRPVNAGSPRGPESTRPSGRTNHHGPHDASRRPARTSHAHTH